MGLSTPDITSVSNAWSTGTEWTVGEDLGSDHLPITTTIRCEEPAASAFQCRARWNTRNVDWNAFSAGVEEAIKLFSTAPMPLGDRVHCLNSVLLAAAKLMWKSLRQLDTPSPGPPWSFDTQSKSKTLFVEQSQTTGLNTWRPVRDPPVRDVCASPPEEMGGIPGRPREQP